MEIYAEVELAPADAANRSYPRSDFGRSRAFARLEDFVHVGIVLKQLAKAVFDDDRHPQVGPPPLQQLQGGREQDDVADGTETNDEDSGAWRKGGEQ
jgi:hypothetical protein